MSLTKIVIIATSHMTMGDTSEPTGIWFEELATPYYEFVDAGYQVDIVSIKGGRIPIDPRSQKPIGENEASVDRFLQDAKSMQKIQTTVSIDGFDLSEFDAVFFPGGHGTMWDFPNQEILASAITKALSENKVVAAVCHGPAVFVGVKDSQGTYVVNGRKIAGFTNDEEAAANLIDVVPFLLEDSLKEMGAVYQSGPAFESFAVKDGNLITGQNPASSRAVAQLVINALNTSNEKGVSQHE